jgi:hypothetical protein
VANKQSDEITEAVSEDQVEPTEFDRRQALRLAAALSAFGVTAGVAASAAAETVTLNFHIGEKLVQRVPLSAGTLKALKAKGAVERLTLKIESSAGAMRPDEAFVNSLKRSVRG